MNEEDSEVEGSFVFPQKRANERGVDVLRDLYSQLLSLVVSVRSVRFQSTRAGSDLQ